MSFRHRDQFSFVLTSDGSMDVFPTNKTSSFKVELSRPLEFGEREWEVALEYVNYPYSWVNVGPAAGTEFKYFYDENSGVKELKFPNWLCNDKEKMVEYMNARIGEDIGPSKVIVALDRLDRFKIFGKSLSLDVGMSWPMMKLLGLAGHPCAGELTVEEFEKRIKYRVCLNDVWKKQFDYGDYLLRKAVLETVDGEKSYSAFVRLIVEYVDFGNMREMYTSLMTSDDGSLKFQEVDTDWLTKFMPLLKKELESQNLGNLGEGQEYDEVYLHIMGLFTVWYYLYKILACKALMATIKATTPGNLNPVERMYIYTNLIEPIDFNDGAVRLLKMVNTRGDPFKTTHEEFVKPNYLPVEKGKMSIIEVYVTDASGKQVPFQVGTLMLMLHFRRRSFSDSNQVRYF